MSTFILWYLLISLIGLVSFPLTYRLFPALADRGYSLSKILGLLVWGYVFWLFASLGIIQNNIGGLVLGLAVLIGLSYWAVHTVQVSNLIQWWQENRRVVLTIEAVFLGAFALWTFVRAANPEIVGTEKPMELAFINAILNSPVFPPHDPWLSGYSISYYYFGYVITAMIAKLTGTPGSIAFNMALSQTFALTTIASFGVMYSLLTFFKRSKGSPPVTVDSQKLFLSFSGPVFILIVSNFEGFLETLHAKGLFWFQDTAGEFSSRFWVWLDMKELSVPPAQPFSWVPSRYLWWWRASRVVQDYDLAGSWREVIDEFPFFSYLLGDLHPHVLVMPFALLSIGLILNLFLGGARGRIELPVFELSINTRSLIVSALVIGGLAFLNTWDFPMYVFLFSLAYSIRGIVTDRRKDGSNPDQSDLENKQPPASERTPLLNFTKDFIKIAVILSVSGILLYLPFYFGFSSQAGGILPNLIYSTRGAHLWVMFGSLLLPIFVYLIWFGIKRRQEFRILHGFFLASGFLIFLWIVSLIFAIGLANIPILGNIYLNSMGGESGVGLLAESISRRVSGMGWISLLFLLTLTTAYLYNLFKPKTVNEFEQQNLQEVDMGSSNWLIRNQPTSQDFVFLLILTGCLLVVFAEFFFLRDQFGSRMNTIFKFYFQTWIFWGLAAAFASAVLLIELKRMWGVLFRLGLGIMLVAACTYPFLSILNKTNGFNPNAGFTLDGISYLENNSPEEMAGIRWLENAPPGVVIEAVGPQYSEYARVSTISGQPGVLGWPGHESQWRGGRKEIGTRQEDIESIYGSNSWEDTKLLLDMYNVRYIFIGPLERRSYRVNEAKFERFLGAPVYQTGQVSIYEVPGGLDSSQIN